MTGDEPRYLWLAHQPASARWLKQEIAAHHPALRPAFARPGLTTFRLADDAHFPARCPSSFAPAWGHGLGPAPSFEQAQAKIARAWALACAATGHETQAPCRVHVFERAPARARDEIDTHTHGRWVRACVTALYGQRRLALVEAAVAAGEPVVDVIVPHGSAAHEAWTIGWHVSGPETGVLAGGAPWIPAPPHAPSRAWSKIEEAIAWSGLQPPAGDCAVELGAAPGGACVAMLERGLDVIAVDPGDLHPTAFAVAERASRRLVHVRRPAAEVRRGEIARARWLLMDVNLAPMVALKYVERFTALLSGQLRGAFLTLKLNDDGVFEALARLRQRIERLGGRRVRITQLPSHRSEVVAVVEF